jgi:hypothetical protein
MHLDTSRWLGEAAPCGTFKGYPLVRPMVIPGSMARMHVGCNVLLVVSMESFRARVTVKFQIYLNADDTMGPCKDDLLAC